MQRAVRFLHHVEARLDQAQACVHGVNGGGASGFRVERSRERAPHPVAHAHSLRLRRRFHYLARSGIDAADHPSIIANDTLSIFAESFYYDIIVYQKLTFVS
ncbi:MAG: hypothetical protein JOZ94_05975 [Xanthobacteraceae bacterium]|nr:hypothetical protein [Xanthobacteraceae bacterium]MBV9631047.1 hypothetical protein [Xanthobacteraceae bacterium]